MSLVKAADWDVAKQVHEFPRELLKFVPETIAAWKSAIRPLKLVEARLDGSETRKAKMAFIPLGTKQQPGLADHKAETWVNAVIASLSDKPVRCIQAACTMAMHRTFAFPTDLEQFLRDKAEECLNEEVRYIARLRALMDAISGRQLELAARPAECPMSKEEIRELVRNPSDLNTTLIRMGIGCGSIDATLLAQVREEEGLTDEAQG